MHSGKHNSDSEDWSPEERGFQTTFESCHYEPRLRTIGPRSSVLRRGIDLQEHNRQRNRQIDCEGYESYSPGAGLAEDRFENGKSKYGSTRCREYEAVDNRRSSAQRLHAPQYDPCDQKESNMGKDQCQNETPLLQQEVPPDIHHSNKQRSRQSKGHCQLAKTRSPGARRRCCAYQQSSQEPAQKTQEPKPLQDH